MSNFEPLSTQPDWREQYPSFPLQEENGLLQPPYEQSAASELAEHHPDHYDVSVGSQLEHRDSSGHLHQEIGATQGLENPESAPGDSGDQVDLTPGDSLVSTDSTALSTRSNQLSSTSSVPARQVPLANHNGEDAIVNFNEEEEDEELDEDEDMLETEEEKPPQTAAERRAERRKMKRFRLTHQQTRFLMSEFAKQAHPDAAHRDRLSREIPGLSPRQVQVWFQNRRAKIKRLTVDDRDRMMKMRAVPDDFDNVQALHSPYGATHGISTPLQSPVDFVPTYTDPLLRPLMVDTMRRNDGDEHISPTGLNSTYGHIGFAPVSSMTTPDILSPPSLNSTYSSHLTSPISAGSRSSNPFERQNNFQAPSHARQNVHSLQPLQLRETLSRSRSESLQSPLRSSMSWKGETLDYASFQLGQQSPQEANLRQQSIYSTDQVADNAVQSQQYDVNAYSNTNIQSSPPQIGHRSTHGLPNSSLQQSGPATLSRIRASSSVYPQGIDIRNQYRAFSSNSSSSQGRVPGQRRSSFTHSFSNGYATAPLVAPNDFSLPRTPVEISPGGGRDFNIPQLSVPMAPPQDFSNAYDASMSPVKVEREFNSQGQSSSNSGNRGIGKGYFADQQQQQNRQFNDGSYLRGGYEAVHKRKRSFTIPTTLESL